MHFSLPASAGLILGLLATLGIATAHGSQCSTRYNDCVPPYKCVSMPAGSPTKCFANAGTIANGNQCFDSAECQCKSSRCAATEKDPNFKICVAGDPHRLQGDCSKDAACYPNLRCLNAGTDRPLCLPNSTGQRCTKPSDCLNGIECSSGSCGGLNAKCTVDEHCTTKHCLNSGKCGNTRSSRGRICSIDNDCDGIIKCSRTCGGTGAFCINNSNCESGSCDTLGNGRCTQGKIAIGGLCNIDQECSEPISCGSGKCGGIDSYCYKNADCMSDYICAPSSRHCATPPVAFGYGCLKDINCLAPYKCGNDKVCGGRGTNCTNNSGCTTSNCAKYGPSAREGICAASLGKIGANCAEDSYCIAARTSNGSTCSIDDDCQSRSCIKNSKGVGACVAKK